MDPEGVNGVRNGCKYSNKGAWVERKMKVKRLKRGEKGNEQADRRQNRRYWEDGGWRMKVGRGRQGEKGGGEGKKHERSRGSG